MQNIPNTTQADLPATQIGCIAGAMAILSAKWTPLVIKSLAQGPRRFSELERDVEGINPRILTQRIDFLEEKGIVQITCTCTAQRPVYELTEKGRDLLPVLATMAEWGQKHRTCC